MSVMSDRIVELLSRGKTVEIKIGHEFDLTR